MLVQLRATFVSAYELADDGGVATWVIVVSVLAGVAVLALLIWCLLYVYFSCKRGKKMTARSLQDAVRRSARKSSNKTDDVSKVEKPPLAEAAQVVSNQFTQVTFARL